LIQPDKIKILKLPMIMEQIWVIKNKYKTLNKIMDRVIKEVLIKEVLIKEVLVISVEEVISEEVVSLQEVAIMKNIED